MKKLKLASIAAASLAAIFISSGSVLAEKPYEATYITNGDFEKGMEGWNQTWQWGEGKLEIVSKGGNKMVHLKSETGSCYVWQDFKNIAEGDRLTLTFRMKIESLGEKRGCADITIGYYDKAGQYITQGYYTYYETTDGKWTYKSIDLLVPPGTGTMKLLMRLYEGGEIYYDDIDVTDFDNKTELTITKGELEMDSVPKGIGTLTANLHYVPKEVGEKGKLIFAMYENGASGEKELIGMDVKPFSADKALYLKTDLEVPDDAENVSVSAYVWKDGQVAEPIAESLTLPRKGRRSVFDTFAVEKMRGVYDSVDCFYDEERMKKLEEHGINTFIFNIIGDFKGGNINKDQNALDAVCADMEEYVEKTGNQIFMKASYASEAVVRNVAFGAYHPGTVQQLILPCPLSEEYWEAEMLSRLEVVAKHPKIIGVVFDMEMYTGGQTRYPGPCMCDACVEKFANTKGTKYAKGLLDAEPEHRLVYMRENKMSDEYKNWFSDEMAKLTSKMRERLHAINPDLILGIMPAMEWVWGMEKGLGTEEMPAMVFDENTYRGTIGITDTNKAKAKLENWSVVFAVGLWPNERHSAIRKADFAAKIIEAEPKDVGYWIYSATEMDNEPIYYNGLKKGNEKILEINQTTN